MTTSRSEGVAIPIGNKGREDRFRLPMRQNDTKWTFEPIYVDEDDETIIALSMDKANAGANAVALVWPDTNVNPLLCNMHAGARFVCNDRLDFNNFEDNKTITQTDIHHHLKNLAHENFVATAKLKMVQKWESVLKEPTVARKWCDSWRNDSLTRVESNRQETSPLRGGVPADNNAVESGNNADKQAMERRKHPLFAFVEEMAQRMVHDDSILDTRHEDEMKRWSGKKFNKAVFNMDHFEECRRLELLHEAGLPTFFSLSWKHTDFENDVPAGSRIIAGQHCVNAVKQLEGGNEIANDVKALKKCLGSNRKTKPGWVKIFKHSIQDPETVGSEQTFDMFCDCSKCFHILRPIVPDDDGPVDTAIRHHVKWLTRICKFPMASEDDIIAMGDKGLVSCTCEDCLHHVFCKHSFLTGKKRETFLGYPPTLDPSPTSSNVRTGRPTRIRGGEALNRNG